jgi:hypothetical protein
MIEGLLFVLEKIKIIIDLNENKTNAVLNELNAFTKLL